MKILGVFDLRTGPTVTDVFCGGTICTLFKRMVLEIKKSEQIFRLTDDDTTVIYSGSRSKDQLPLSLVIG